MALTQGLVRQGQLDPNRYARGTATSYDDNLNARSKLEEQQDCLADVFDDDQIFDLEDEHPDALSWLLETETAFDDHVCHVARATHTLELQVLLYMECSNLARAQRMATFMSMVNVGVTKVASHAASTYPECYANFDKTKRLASANAARACVREKNEPTLTQARATFELEGLSPAEVSRCTDFAAIREKLASDCKRVAGSDGRHADDDANTALCEAELESIMRPVFSSIKAFDEASGFKESC